MSLKQTLRLQGLYYLVTGLWPLIHLASFEAVTGPKTDDWLVKMVGLLAAVIGAALLTVARQSSRGTSEILVLAVGSAAAFAAVDVWYVFQGAIAKVYLADAAVESGLIVLLFSSRRL
jgi:energy-converting hydrogenase Eha subunit E